jgi:hypothetical protein
LQTPAPKGDLGPESPSQSITIFEYFERFQIGHGTSNRVDNLLIFGRTDRPTLRGIACKAEVLRDGDPDRTHVRQLQHTGQIHPPLARFISASNVAWFAF